jgi:DNA-binding NarL/FixJ family response regulator
MQRVLIIGNDSIIGAGIENLLWRERIIDVYGTVTKSASTLLRLIQKIEPHVIIIDRHTTPIRADQLWLLLSQPCDLNLIEINAITPYMRIFTKKQIWLTRPVTLASAIDWLINPNKKEFMFILKEAASL